MDTVTIDGRSFDAVSFPTAHSVVLMIRGGKGFLGCGYLSVATADKTGDALAIVSGVKNYDDMLKAEVRNWPDASAGHVQTGRFRWQAGQKQLLLPPTVILFNGRPHFRQGCPPRP